MPYAHTTCPRRDTHVRRHTPRSFIATHLLDRIPIRLSFEGSSVLTTSSPYTVDTRHIDLSQPSADFTGLHTCQVSLTHACRSISVDISGRYPIILSIGLPVIRRNTPDCRLSPTNTSIPWPLSRFHIRSPASCRHQLSPSRRCSRSIPDGAWSSWAVNPSR